MPAPILNDETTTMTLISRAEWYHLSLLAEVYSEPYQISKMDLFAKIVNGF